MCLSAARDVDFSGISRQKSLKSLGVEGEEAPRSAGISEGQVEPAKGTLRA